jgi:hypothetical protein
MHLDKKQMTFANPVACRTNSFGLRLHAAEVPIGQVNYQPTDSKKPPVKGTEAQAEQEAQTCRF